MSKSVKSKKKIIIFAVVIFAVILLLIWYNVPSTFLKSTDASEVAFIQVFNGNSGNKFDITNKEQISYIVENVQKQAFDKEGLSLFRMGTLFTLSFCDSNGKVVSEFTVNSDNTIRKDPFFYVTDGNMNIIEYLQFIEEEMELK